MPTVKSDADAPQSKLKPITKGTKMHKFIITYQTYCGKVETTWVYANSIDEAAREFNRYNGGNTILSIQYA